MKKRIAVLFMSMLMVFGTVFSAVAAIEGTSKKYGEVGQTIYVSPTGTDKASGNVNDPMDIYTAVKYVQAGQTIVLKEGTYELEQALTIERGNNGTVEAIIRMIADPNATTRPVLDFKGAAFFVTWGDYWYFRGFDITNSLDLKSGMQLAGSNNVLDQLNFYKNGGDGIQISGSSTETIDEWPSYNFVLNCTSYNNRGDGFSAKLTSGFGNVFDGCIAYSNAKNGWNLEADTDLGRIGQVTIRNSVAYRNGTDSDTNNGDGFRMGSSNINGEHIIINSIAFENKGCGINSNGCPDIQSQNCILFNNESYNIALSTETGVNTNFKVTGLLSSKENKVIGDQLKLASQDNTQVYATNNFYYYPDGDRAENGGDTVETTIKFIIDGFALINGTANGTGFQSTDTLGINVTRYSDGGINMNGLLQFTAQAVQFLADNGVVVGAFFYEGLSPSFILGQLGASVPAYNNNQADNPTDGKVPTGDNINIYVCVILSIVSGIVLLGCKRFTYSQSK